LDDPVNRRRWTWLALAVAGALLVAGVAAIAYRQHQSSGQDAEARQAAASLAADWQSGHLDRVAWDGSTGAAMQAEYRAAVAGMGSARPAVRVARVQRTGDRASADLAVTWDVTRQGSNGFGYRSRIRLVQRSGRWLAAPDGPAGSSVFAPITRDARLVLVRAPAARAAITGRGGRPIVSEGTVVDVGIEPARVVDASTLVRAVARTTGVQPGPLTAALAAASPHAFVPVITLRESDYVKVRDRLQPLHGTVFRRRLQSLPLTRDFARALLGSVGPVTADILQASGNRYQTGDFAGVSGLQKLYDDRLTGTPAYTVVERPLKAPDSSSDVTLFQVDATAGRPLATTIDAKTQLAADQALAGLKVPAALVAVDVRTGGVLAVANNPSNGLDSALVGRYPPGSTLKVATTLALLGRGVTPKTQVSCPARVTVGGRTFRNFEHEQLGTVPFSTDFKNSCNTAFVGLSRRLQPADLHDAALQLGLGGDWAAGLGAGPLVFTGNIPTTDGAVDQAAAAFGQGRNLVSPLSMAVLAASVARGRFLAPTLVTTPAPSGTAWTQPAAPSARSIATLRALMRLVVTSGTAAGQFAGVAGGAVYGKTGTAEFGRAAPPQTHAWFVGWQDDVAFAAFVEKGRSGGSVAAPVVRDFLHALHRS
jgi:cell division protein FtsI/penicillin-binding protein 2